MSSRWRGIGLTALSLVLPPAWAERLPCTSYTIADGLPHNYVTSILQDSREFIWFGTMEGLARYDGVRFKTYDTRDGLPHRAVSFVHETRDHLLWIGTPRGLCRLDPRRASGKAFQCWAPEGGAKVRQAHTLFEDSGGTLWLGTEGGPFRVLRASEPGGTPPVSFEPLHLGTPGMEQDRSIRSFAEHPPGVLWAGGGSGIYRRMPDGTTVRFTTREGLPENTVGGLMCDREGRIWVGFWDRGLALLVKNPQPGRPVVERLLRFDDPRLSNKSREPFQASDGRLFVTMGNALTEISLDPLRPVLRARRYTRANGLTSELPLVVAEDREGNIWVGSSDAGAMKIQRSGFVAFGHDDGIRLLDTSFVADVPGDGLVIGRPDLLHNFDGRKFNPVVPNLPAEMFRDPTLLGWGWNQTILRDHEGVWWIPTERGIFRFAKPSHLRDLARARPKAHYTTRNGLPYEGIFRLFEDSRGNVWISAGGGDLRVVVWDRRQNRFVAHKGKGDVPEQKPDTATSFAEDKDGNIWIGFFEGGLSRYVNGRWDYFDPSDGAPSGFVNDLLVDRAGRLWIAYNGGVKRIDDTRAAVPRFITYTREHGLPSSAITSLAEDEYGGIYLGMNSRVSRLDPRFPPEQARLKHYTAADGLTNGNVRATTRDRNGAIWTVGVNGVARLMPDPPRSEPPAPVRIVGLRGGGTPRALSEFGETEVGGFSFPEKGAPVEIEFVSTSYVSGKAHSYTCRLEGAASDWSRPSAENTVTLAGLAPGRYRFVVKAVSHDSDAESEPAVLEFSITAPLYRREWFVTLLGLTAALGVIVFYRTRWRRAVALERIRMQIATDLHDELGAGLSQVAMMSEVALLGSREEERATALARIAKLSRELLDSASDLVWAIRPKRDRVSDLAQRMREFAAEALSLLDIRFEFNVAPDAVNLKLDPEQRRQAFAVFKETINNAVRHSGCSRVRVDLSREDGTLVLATWDDGRGLGTNIDPETAGRHGIAGMKWRAQMLGGALELDSPSGNGLRVTLRVPLAAKGRRRAPA